MSQPVANPISNRADFLLRKVGGGDRRAFDELYDLFSTPMYSLALKMLRSEPEAQDLLQEVFVVIWDKAAGYRAEKGSGLSWLLALVRNRAIDYLRTKQRQAELLEEFSLDLEPSGGEPAGSLNMELNERRKAVRMALTQLSTDQRQVLALGYFEGLSQSQISEKLEEPLGTIKARSARGMAKLRELLRSLHA